MTIAFPGRDDAIYLGSRPIGSDSHSNGGMLFMWIAPVAVGIAALAARRITVWKSIALIAAELVSSRVFGFFSPGRALVIEGVIWLTLGIPLLEQARVESKALSAVRAR